MDLQPSIYRYHCFKRYQTVIYEANLLSMKPKMARPPLTYTAFDLEWLMLCQHYGIPTRLMDWSNDVLVALFFACLEEDQPYRKDGALFICNQNDYQIFAAFDKKVMEAQELTFVSTNIINPRMRAQSGCFMLWGHSPLDNEKSKESYDLGNFNRTQEKNISLRN
ncbi:MAG: FRG domain-containing protein [Bacteroidetes bacterium]|nr:FRG domain-containing protein [Bacteroidota bacterium]